MKTTLTIYVFVLIVVILIPQAVNYFFSTFP